MGIKYDIIIIGAGISGLYIAYKLQSKYKILILEKNSYIGGRIYTKKFKHNNINYQYEAGGARFAETHTNIKDLINELQLNNDITKISNAKTPIVKNLTYNDKNLVNKIYNLPNDYDVQDVI